MSFFVFNNILASVVSFFVFSGPRFSRVPGLLRFFSRSEACPRQCVHKMTTTVGYHKSSNLSSKNCKKSGPDLPNSVAPHGQTATREWVAPKCRPAPQPWPESESLPPLPYSGGCRRVASMEKRCQVPFSLTALSQRKKLRRSDMP